MTPANENDTDHAPNMDKATWKHIGKEEAEAIRAEASKAKRDKDVIKTDAGLRIMTRIGEWWYSLATGNVWKCPDVNHETKTKEVTE